MLASLFNLLFGCHHKNISFPMSSGKRTGLAGPEAYVVCLDCGKRFRYDWQTMRIAQPADRPRGPSQKGAAAWLGSKLRYLWSASALPAAWVLARRVFSEMFRRAAG